MTATPCKQTLQKATNFLPSSEWRISIFFHLILVVVVTLAYKSKPVIHQTTTKVRVVNQSPAQNIRVTPSDLKPITPRTKKIAPQKIPSRAVFGVSRSAITSDLATRGIETKAGNTLAKDPDQLELRPEDEGAMPTPTDEFLVDKMPRQLNQISVAYPPSAKQKKIQGTVVLQVLIDEQGKVRNVTLISGPDEELNQTALAAVQRLTFEPATASGAPVAVSITIRHQFILENE